MDTGDHVGKCDGFPFKNGDLLKGGIGRKTGNSYEKSKYSAIVAAHEKALQLLKEAKSSDVKVKIITKMVSVRWIERLGWGAEETFEYTKRDLQKLRAELTKWERKAAKW